MSLRQDTRSKSHSEENPERSAMLFARSRGMRRGISKTIKEIPRPFGARNDVVWILIALFIVGCTTITVTPPTTQQPNHPTTPSRPTIQPPTLTPQPTPTIIPTPTPKTKQITSGGCCVNPFWSPDGTVVMFVDKPNETASAGILGVKLNGEPPQLITAQVGIFSPDFKYVAYPKATETVIAEINGSKQWVVREAGGRSISFSPDSKLISWQVSSSLVNFDLRTTEVWVANVDGTQAKKIASLFGGGVSWWLPDSAKMLATIRKEANTDPILNILNIADGKLTPVAQASSFRSTMLSPDGAWIIYQIAFSGEAAKDGIWVMRSDGKDLRRLEIFGSYRWRADGKILFVPLENITGKQSHRFVEVDAATGNARALTDPNVTPFRIANGDWSLSPDGKRVVFLNTEDGNLWTIDLP